MPNTKFRLAIIEDRMPVLESLRSYFDDNNTQFDLLIAAREFDELVYAAWSPECLDVLLCDIGLPNKSGIEVTWYIKRKFPHIQVVMFTVFDDKEHIFQALCAGASGYLLKSTPLPEMEQLLVEVMKGGSVMSPQVARLVISHFNPALDHKIDYRHREQLTPREIEIVSLLQQGYTYKKVAETAFISVDTVKFHIRNIYGKLQVNSRSELMLKYNKPI
ncbi:MULTISPECIES: response regulator transcription factor [unclassified Sphingobacterium]|uniref:response regulator n=1 Tax=unclassified Sphingobacterium TaxID=2609468 RepID=UPI001AE73C8D|nr:MULTISPECIES: response regulator transcription factor [unclassified Sphingobacterium]MDR6733733.1 DNA-binding NarL/FixJ family response regulator [Sphingobacterium sp. 2149]